jgi:adenine-specific DNA-methyltransferase
VVRGRGARHVLPQTEYVLVYAHTLAQLPPFAEPITDAMRDEYGHTDERGRYKLIPLAKSGTSHSARPNLFYEIVAPDGTQIACPTHQWRWSRETLAARMDEILFKQGKQGRWMVFTKQYLDLPDGERERTPISYYDRATTTDGTKELKALFGRVVIDFPKPTRLIKDLITWALPRDPSDEAWILDFFAGSCPTAQAVLELNHEDGGARRFICVQAEVPLDDPEFVDIAAVGLARIARVREALGSTEAVHVGRVETTPQASPA